MRTPRVECPLLALWGEKGVVHRLFDPIADWKSVARDVRGKAAAVGALPRRGGAGARRWPNCRRFSGGSAGVAAVSEGTGEPAPAAIIRSLAK